MRLTRRLSGLGIRRRFALLCGAVGIVGACVIALIGPEPYGRLLSGYLDAAPDADADAAVEFVCEASRPIVLDPAWAPDAQAQREQLGVRGVDRRRGENDRAVVYLLTEGDPVPAGFDIGTEDGDRCIVVEPGRPFGVAVDDGCQPRSGLVCIVPSG